MKREEQKRNSTEDLAEVYRVAASGELQSQNYRRNIKEHHLAIRDAGVPNKGTPS